MEQDPSKRASSAELADMLDKSDRAHIDVLGGALHTIAHPIKSGALNLAVAAITVPLTGFGYVANNLVRLSLAADRRKDVVDEIVKKYSHGTPPPAAP
jgi:hypothetical protein